MRKLSVMLAVSATLLCGTAFAQNVLVNGDFETNPPAALGNNIGHSIAPWVLGTGDQSNVVKVDGPGGYNYGNSGPESDASAPGAGVPQHYLDIADGNNDFYQSFTPRCSGEVSFGGAFSTRANSPGTASVTLRQGVGTSGPIVGTSNPVTLGFGNSATDPWQVVTFTAPVTAATTYSFIVEMDNEMNFDNGFVRYRLACEPPPPVDPCCPPWSKSALEDMLFYQGSGSIVDPYTLRFQPSATFLPMIQGYIDYLNVLNPAMNAITIHFRLHDAGTANTPVVGAQIGSDHWVTWNAGGGGTANPPVNFFSLGAESMQINRWYRVHTGIYLEGGQTFFPASCADNDIDVRVQVQHALLRAPVRVLQFRIAGGRIVEKKIDR